MTNSYFSLGQLSGIDSKSTVRFLIYLRLLVASLALIGLVAWDITIQQLEHWSVFLPLIVSVLIWSMLVLLKTKLQTTKNAEAREIIFDLLWISALVFLSGGASNPFIYYFLVIIALSATLLTNKQAWFVCGISIFVYSFLLALDASVHFRHLELGYRIHLVGMWLNYLVSALVICFFVSNLVLALRHQHLQMQDIREKNLKNEQLIGLATVSASAVHNLATPLSTLRLLVEELEPDDTNQDELPADIELMKQQIFRCQTTIKQLSLLAQKSDQLEHRDTNSFIDDIREHYSLSKPENSPNIQTSLTSPLDIYINDLCQYAVINLINNAIESSSDEAKVSFSSKNNFLEVEIINTCNTSKLNLLEQWGQPTQSSKTSGLGIGSFLANSTIERIGGSVSIETKESSNEANPILVYVTVKIPLKNSEERPLV